MKVLYFSRSYTPHDRRFLEKIAGAGHAAFFLRLREDLRQEGRPLPAGVRPLRWGGGPAGEAPRDLAARLPRLKRILRDVRPDVVHAGPVPTCGYLTARTGFRPWLAMSWGSDLLVDAERSAFAKRAARAALSAADRCVCDCRTVRRKIQSLARVPSRRILQFPWGVDVKAFAPRRGPSALRRRLGWEDAFVVLSLRSWEKIYGIDALLKAFRRLHRRNPSARLLLLGDGSLAPRVRDFLKRHSLRDAVRCPGRVPEDRLPAFFQAADAYVSCAVSDGTSVSLLQALSAGLPVVVTDHPSNREWVAAGRNGWFGKAGREDTFARALERAAALTPAARARLSARNRRRALAGADWDSNVRKLLAAYRELAGKKTWKRN